MKILVLGGSYFYGRVFTMLTAKQHQLTLLNRGTYSMDEWGVTQLTGDRHDAEVLEQLKEWDAEFDAVVDFCGYASGDIFMIIRHLPCKVKQYVFISTVDVYQRGIKGLKNEETPYENRSIPGDAGAYIAGKISLEKELKEVCEKEGIAYTILRPAILYGPYNYAPREALYIQMLVQNHLLPEIIDANGKFQFTYVKDAAKAVCKCLLNAKTYGQSYNICGDEILNYSTFINGLEKAYRKAEKHIATDVADNGKGTDPDGKIGSLQRFELTAKQAEEQGIPLPFPVYEEETELYSNEKSRHELGISYTSFEEGIGKTYSAFQGVFG